MKKNLFIPLICLTAASITTLSISYADTASSKEKTTPSKKQALNPKLRLSQVPMKMYH